MFATAWASRWQMRNIVAFATTNFEPCHPCNPCYTICDGDLTRLPSKQHIRWQQTRMLLDNRESTHTIRRVTCPYYKCNPWLRDTCQFCSWTHWAYSTGKVPSNNFRLRPQRTVKMLLTEAGQSNGKVCPRSYWKHYLDWNLTCSINYWSLNH